MLLLLQILHARASCYQITELVMPGAFSGCGCENPENRARTPWVSSEAQPPAPGYSETSSLQDEYLIVSWTLLMHIQEWEYLKGKDWTH